ncbi:MAG TPA: CehA/McbA family metallohydrolase [Candidatus Sulfotelmatobacter sp.]|nr:CehA/McbA family metallohydrolase [Candidatus Sulfotelmatobacter sp.]
MALDPGPAPTANTFELPGRFHKGNLHTHSTASDGARPAAEVCRAYREAGYDFIALTDHFLPRYGYPVTDTRAFRETGGFTTLFGAELHVPATALGELWHILAVGLPLDFAPPADGESAAGIARRARDAGAFVCIVHPAWYGLTLQDVESVPHAHAIEIYNHTGAVRTDRGDGSMLLDQLLAAGRRITACATDDAHFHVDDAFGGWVMVKAPSAEPADLVAALRAGHFYASQGPAIHAVGLRDETIEIECSPAAAVILLGRGSRAENVLGRELRRASLPLARVRQGGYGRVVVVDDAGRRAWSNPFWFDRS